MNVCGRNLITSVIIAAGASVALASVVSAATVPLAAHRAIYELALAKTRSNNIVAARGFEPSWQLDDVRYEWTRDRTDAAALR